MMVLGSTDSWSLNASEAFKRNLLSFLNINTCRLVQSPTQILSQVSCPVLQQDSLFQSAKLWMNVIILILCVAILATCLYQARLIFKKHVVNGFDHSAGHLNVMNPSKFYQRDSVPLRFVSIGLKYGTVHAGNDRNAFRT